MHTQPWKAPEEDWAPPPPPHRAPHHGPHHTPHRLIPPHVDIMHGLETISAQQAELQSAVERLQSTVDAMSNHRDHEARD